MKEKIEALLAEIQSLSCKTQQDIENARVHFLGKKGEITALFDEFRSVPPEMKREVGQKLNQLKETFRTLRDIRTPAEQEWKQICRFVSPRGGDFDCDTEPRYRKRDESQMELFDKTIYLYSQIFAMGLKGYVCSSQSHFFSLIPSDPRDISEESKRMLQAQTEQMYDALASTRFYKATELLFRNFGDFGTSVMLLGYDIDTASFLSVHST